VRKTISRRAWKYVTVRRPAMFIEAGLDDGMRWAVYKPIDALCLPKSQAVICL